MNKSLRISLMISVLTVLLPSFIRSAESTAGRLADSYEIPQRVAYAGWLQVVEWIEPDGRDLTPPPNRSVAPIRFVVNRNAQGAYSILATRENPLFNIGDDHVAYLDGNGLTFVINNFRLTGSDDFVNITLKLLFQADGSVTGEYRIDSVENTGLLTANIFASVPDPNVNDSFNGRYFGMMSTVEYISTSGDAEIVEDLKDEMETLFEYLDQGFVQVGNLVTYSWITRPNAKEAFPRSLSKSIINPLKITDTYLTPSGSFVGDLAGNTATFFVDDNLFEQLGEGEDPYYNKSYRWVYTHNGAVMNCVCTVHEEILAETEDEEDRIGEITMELRAIPLNETIDILQFEVNPNPVRAGETVNIRAMLYNQFNQINTNYSGNIQFKLKEESSDGVGRLNQESARITNGISQWIEFLTPEEPYSASKNITEETFLSGTAILEATLENSDLRPVDITIPVKSPFDFYMEKIEVLQSVTDLEKPVTKTLESGEVKSYQPLPLIAEHNTAVIISVKANNTGHIEYSKIDHIPGIWGELKVKKDGEIIITYDRFGCAWNGKNPFKFKDTPPTDIDHVYLNNVLVKNLEPGLVKEPANYTFEFNLSFDSNIDEVTSEKVNNEGTISKQFVATKPIHLLAGMAAFSSTSFPSTVSVNVWNLMRDIYPVQQSKLIYTDPNSNREIFPQHWYHGKNVRYFSEYTSTLLTQHNKNNTSKQCLCLVYFVTPEFIKSFKPFFVDQIPGVTFGKAVLVADVVPITVCHEIGHQFGLSDTYKSFNASLESPNPNPRFSNATGSGNPVEDGNIHFQREYRIRRSFDIFLDMMGNEPVRRWADRVTWNHLYSQLQIASSPKMMKIDENEFITVSGFITKSDSAFFNPCVLMNSVPYISESEPGPYSIEFLDETDNILRIYNFELAFFVSGVGETETEGFYFHFPYPEQSVEMVLKKEEIVLASQSFSKNVPQIELIQPVNGDTINGEVQLKWTASDTDGDELTYSIIYSADGEDYIVVQVGLTETNFTWETEYYPNSSSGTLSVIANDGINEGKATAVVTVQGGTGIQEDQSEQVAEQFQLFQNYPNPFNPTTQIGFAVPHSENVIIQLFDIQGRFIQTLVNQDYDAGSHRIHLDASHLSAGMYVYKMQAGDFMDVKKLVVMK